MMNSAAKLKRRAFLALTVVALSAPWAKGDAIFVVKSTGPGFSSIGVDPSHVGNQWHGALFDSSQPGGVAIGSGTSPYAGPLPAGASPGSGALGGEDGSNQVGWAAFHVGGSNWNFAFANLGGQVDNLGTLPGTKGSEAYGVNQAGQVVGSAYGVGGDLLAVQPFLFTVGAGMTPIATPGGGSGMALDINNAGLVVGAYGTAPGGSGGRAFISDNGGPAADLNHMIDPSLGWTILRAGEIDNAGNIAAIGMDSFGMLHALILAPASSLTQQQVLAAIDQQGAADAGSSQPVPEPTTLAFFTLAAAGLSARRLIRARRNR